MPEFSEILENVVETRLAFDLEDIARAYRVPYWLVEPGPRPSWFRRPIWRLRAWRWSRG